MDADQPLLDRLRAGDEAAFVVLVDRYDTSLRRVARTFVSTGAVADDVVQETWLGVIRGLDGFEGRSSLRTWIFRILENRARTRGVREKRSVPFSSLQDGAGNDHQSVDPAAFDATGHWRSAPLRFDTDPETHALGRELRAQVRDAVDDLPDAQRAVITLRDIVGMTSEEVCALLDVTPGNQRVLLHRARSRVRSSLAHVVELSS